MIFSGLAYVIIIKTKLFTHQLSASAADDYADIYDADVGYEQYEQADTGGHSHTSAAVHGPPIKEDREGYLEPSSSKGPALPIREDTEGYLKPCSSSAHHAGLQTMPARRPKTPPLYEDSEGYLKPAISEDVILLPIRHPLSKSMRSLDADARKIHTESFDGDDSVALPISSNLVMDSSSESDN